MKGSKKGKLTPMGANYGGKQPAFLGKMRPGTTDNLATGKKGSSKKLIHEGRKGK